MQCIREAKKSSEDEVAITCYIEILDLRQLAAKYCRRKSNLTYPHPRKRIGLCVNAAPMLLKAT